MMEQRKHPRLKGYDYSQGGDYFVTICTRNREKILSRISPVGPDDLIGPIPLLSKTGEIVERYILGIKTAYPGITVDQYAIMPNHIHLLLRFPTPEGGPMGSSGPTLGMVVRGMKRMVTKEIGHSIFQPSFYDHVIRDEPDYLTKWNYISTNPARWTEDEYYA